MSTHVSVVPTHNSIAIDFREWLGPTYGSVAVTETPAATPVELGPSLSIAISREAGTPAVTTAEQVGQRMGWHVYDRDLIEAIAEDMHLPPHLLKSMDEHPQSWLAEAMGAFLSPAWRPMGNAWVSEEAFIHSVVKTIRRIGAAGHAVIVGRGGVFVLPQETTLRVRLIAPLADRIANLSQELGISKEHAKRKLAAIDREQREFVINHFHQDPSEPRHYDLVLNCARFDVEAQVEQIYLAMCQLQVKSAVGKVPAGS